MRLLCLLLVGKDTSYAEGSHNLPDISRPLNMSHPKQILVSRLTVFLILLTETIKQALDPINEYKKMEAVVALCRVVRKRYNAKKKKENWRRLHMKIRPN